MSEYDDYVNSLADLAGLDDARATEQQRIERELRETGVRAQRVRDEAVHSVEKLHGRAIDLGVRARRVAQREGVAAATAGARPAELSAGALDELERQLARAERNRDWLDRAVVQPVVQPLPMPQAAPVPPPPLAPTAKKGCAALVLGALAVVACAAPVVAAIGSVLR